jgi:hypothetical protein
MVRWELYIVQINIIVQLKCSPTIKPVSGQFLDGETTVFPSKETVSGASSECKTH